MPRNRLNPMGGYPQQLARNKLLTQQGTGVVGMAKNMLAKRARQSWDENLQGDLQAFGMTPIPVVSDWAGFGGDVLSMARNPEERTWGNLGFATMGLLPFMPGMTVWHGSKHLIDPEAGFDLKRAGTGEGVTNEGYGTYVAEHPLVGRKYAGEGGNLYQVDLPDEHIANMLDLDVPLGQQEALWQRLVDKSLIDPQDKVTRFRSGNALLKSLEGQWGQEAAAQMLLDAGIPGTKFFDLGSRTAAQGARKTRNFAVFDPSIMTILEREGL